MHQKSIIFSGTTLQWGRYNSAKTASRKGPYGRTGPVSDFNMPEGNGDLMGFRNTRGKATEATRRDPLLGGETPRLVGT